MGNYLNKKQPQTDFSQPDFIHELEYFIAQTWTLILSKYFFKSAIEVFFQQPCLK